MSWFSQVSEAIGNLDAVEALGKLNEISTKVQSSLPLDDELVSKLTLRSADLKAEHDLIDSQETRKEMVRDCLSALLPWETRDETRDILVEDCEAAIREMTKYEHTFTGPFELPEGLSMFPSKNRDDSDSDDTDDIDGNNSANESANESPHEQMKIAKDRLEKMGTLPSLLDEFDLDAHVGLIDRLMHTDEDLVEMYARLTNAGKTEKIFWKNYFFNCAFHRYDKGLSVEEIWVVDSNREVTSADEKSSLSQTISSSLAAAVQSVNSMRSQDVDGAHDDADADDSIELTFEQEAEATKTDTSVSSSAQEVATMLDKKSLHSNNNGNDENLTGSAAMSDTSAYEIVETAIIDTDALDEELDELEAEIARELGED